MEFRFGEELASISDIELLLCAGNEAKSKGNGMFFRTTERQLEIIQILGAYGKSMARLREDERNQSNQ